MLCFTDAIECSYEYIIIKPTAKKVSIIKYKYILIYSMICYCFIKNSLMIALKNKLMISCEHIRPILGYVFGHNVKIYVTQSGSAFIQDPICEELCHF